MHYIKNSTVLPIEMAYRQVARRCDDLLQRLIQCSRREVWVLLVVDHVELSQKQIGENLGLHPNVLVKILDGMEARGLLKRIRRQEDRREQVVRATAEGKRRLQIYLENRPKSVLEIFRPLSDKEIEQWRALAMKIITQNSGDIPAPRKDDSGG